MKYYACLSLDVVKSQSLDLKQVESHLEHLKAGLNEQFSNQLIINFDIRKGDELIGVFKSFSDLYRAIRVIEDFSEENDRKITFYIGCGFGKIDTKNKNSIHVANGSAIINSLYARDQIIKEEGREAKIWTSSPNRVFYYTEDFPYSSINALFYFISDLIHRRSQKQKEIVKAVKNNPDATYETIGKKFGYKSPKTSISNHLYAANHELVSESEKSLIELLEYHQNQLEQK